jgi:hypothetical protein
MVGVSSALPRLTSLRAAAGSIDRWWGPNSFPIYDDTVDPCDLEPTTKQLGQDLYRRVPLPVWYPFNQLCVFFHCLFTLR